MKIITNTVESEGLNEEILDSDILNTANITMKEMEERLQGLNGDVANTSYLTKLENDKISKIPNGLTNGLRESSDKSTLHMNASSDFDEISEDDFHLELEADEENGMEASNEAPLTKKKEIIPKAVDVLEENLTSSVSIDVEEIDEALMGECILPKSNNSLYLPRHSLNYILLKNLSFKIFKMVL